MVNAINFKPSSTALILLTTYMDFCQEFLFSFVFAMKSQFTVIIVPKRIFRDSEGNKIFNISSTIFLTFCWRDGEDRLERTCVM